MADLATSDAVTEYRRLINAGFNIYKVIRERGASDLQSAAPPAGTYVLGSGDDSTASAAPFPASQAFYLDPADYAVTGRSSMLRVRGFVVVNATAPATNWTFGLYGVATWGGAAGAVPTIATLSAVTAGSTAAINAPGATAPTTAASADFAFPAAAGYYVLAVVNSGAAAANSRLAAKAVLQLRQV